LFRKQVGDIDRSFRELFRIGDVRKVPAIDPQHGSAGRRGGNDPVDFGISEGGDIVVRKPCRTASIAFVPMQRAAASLTGRNVYSVTVAAQGCNAILERR